MRIIWKPCDKSFITIAIIRMYVIETSYYIDSHDPQFMAHVVFGI